MDGFALEYDFLVSPETLYQAITSKDGPLFWWTTTADIHTEMGQTSLFRFPEAGFFVSVRIARLKENALVEWDCVDAMHPESAGYQNRKDWVGTKMVFQITKTDLGAHLSFQHVGLTSELECYTACEKGWIFYLGQSLKGYLEEGAGQPYSNASSL